jgi:ketopantoate hydroxymethyltransferase
MCTCRYSCATEQQLILAKYKPVCRVSRQDDELTRYNKQPDEEAAQHVRLEHILTQLAELWTEQYDSRDSSLTFTL